MYTVRLAIVIYDIGPGEYFVSLYSDYTIIV